MLYHYIKIAFLDLWKHKVQTVFVFSRQVSDKILPNVNFIQSFNMKFFIILFFLVSSNDGNHSDCHRAVSFAAGSAEESGGGGEKRVDRKTCKTVRHVRP